MEMYLQGEWRSSNRLREVRSPFDGQPIDTVPEAEPSLIPLAVRSLTDGARVMRKTPAYDRAVWLKRAAQLVRENLDDLATTISREEGKPIGESRFEVARSAETLDVSADEARRLTGEMIPLEAAPGATGKIGFTLRQPCGVVAAITPFNFPLNLVCHKVGPALAAGNAVLLKPASDTPLIALKLTRILLDAGVPELAIACVTGPGSTLGPAICDDPGIRKISFTGSTAVGEALCRRAGLKRVTMELGGNAPVIVLDDADVELAATAISQGGYVNAGQVCISSQRILVTPGIVGSLIDALRPKVATLVPGDPLLASTKLGPMIRSADALRVDGWIDEAIAAGAQPILRGQPNGALCPPAILDQVPLQAKISCEELFGPAVAITRCASFDEALTIANDTPYGLAAGLFTKDLERAFRFAKTVDAGNLHVNWSSQWRVDLMPYGGLKRSGLGQEGPKYAIREMTDEKLVVLHLPPEG